MVLWSGRTAVAAVLGIAAIAAGCGRDDDSDAAAGSKGAASPGITDKEITLGGTFPFSGPASAFGTLAPAMQAYFEKVNAEGGVDGRKIVFKTLDDAYDPTKGLQATRRLVERDKVFAIVGTTGTPVNVATMEYLNKRGVPQAFVTTGASLFGADPKAKPWSIGFVPDYLTESRVFAEYLEREHPGAKVAVLYQNDGLGKDYLAGFERALEGSEVKLAAKKSYEVTDPSVASHVSTLKSSGADALVLFTTPKFAAQAISTTKKLGWKPQIVLNSPSSSPEQTLKPAGLEASKGLVTAAYYKEPGDPQFVDDPDVKEYLEAMRQHAPKVDPDDAFALIAWVEAAALVKAIDAMEEPTREAFMRSARNMDTEGPMLLPGIRITTTPDDGYPVQAMQIARFDGESYQLEGEVVDAASGG